MPTTPEMTHESAGCASPDPTRAACPQCEALRRGRLENKEMSRLLAHVARADCFELFGLPRGYAVDSDQLSRAYVALCRNVHPDRYSGEPAEVQAAAERISATVNAAYDTLRDPRRRAEYLLETSGGKTSAEDRRVPAEFLAQTLALREAVDEAKAAGDVASLTALRSRVEAARAESQRRIAELSARLPGGAAEDRDELRLTLNTMTYYENLLGQLEAP